jgi:hypothetical protein
VELERPSIEFKPAIDRRPHMPPPPPVRLVAVEDVRAFAGAGLEVQLDEFYATLLGFEREASDHGQIIYKAENQRLVFEVVEPPLLREDFRPIGIDVASLVAFEHQLIEREIGFTWQRGLTAGQATLLLQDPAGNWVQIGQIKRV